MGLPAVCQGEEEATQPHANTRERREMGCKAIASTGGALWCSVVVVKGFYHCSGAVEFPLQDAHR